MQPRGVGKTPLINLIWEPKSWNPHSTFDLIGHFRFAFCLCVKTSDHAKPFIWSCVLLQIRFHFKSTYFHIKDFKRGFVFERETQGNSEMIHWVWLQPLIRNLEDSLTWYFKLTRRSLSWTLDREWLPVTTISLAVFWQHRLYAANQSRLFSLACLHKREHFSPPGHDGRILALTETPA